MASSRADRQAAQQNAQDCYTMAYFVLPQYVFGQTERILSNLSNSPELGAGFYYVIACGVNEREPRDELIRSFPVHVGTLYEGHTYHVVQYPTPPAVALAADVAHDNLLEAMKGVVLAPYFSAIVQNRQTKAVRYFVLGQSPDGFTTLRLVTPEMNANMGPGCEPEVGRFVDLLRERLAAP